MDASPNSTPRPINAAINMIVIHYTGMATGEKAKARLCHPESQVSAHYLVWENGRTEILVSEARRAWHAGISEWRTGMRSLWRDTNSRSIGIELVNPGHTAGFPIFPDRQMRALIELCQDLVRRYTIRPGDIVAHSDIAPGRKSDPGPMFDWQRLARSGLGYWPVLLPCNGQGGRVWRLHRPPGLAGALAGIGYGVKSQAGWHRRLHECVRSFQLRYRPSRCDGWLDSETGYRLIDIARQTSNGPGKYRANKQTVPTSKRIRGNQ